MRDSQNPYEAKKRLSFIKRVSEILKVSKPEAERLCNIEHGTSFWVNHLKDLPVNVIYEQLSAEGHAVKPISWCSDAYHLSGEKRRLSDSPLFQNGYVYIQNASSMLPSLALSVAEDESILDMCAAPGGKSAFIASRISNRCELWVNDNSSQRVEKMRELFNTFNVHYCQMTTQPAERLNENLHRTFDKILLDAQCSGEGMINLMHPRALRFWSLARVQKFSFLQRKMIRSAFKLLKPGGVLVYSTCTFAPEENEQVVNYLLGIAPEARVEPIDIDLPNQRPGLLSWMGEKYHASLKNAIRVIPSEFMEAFFVCKIVKG